MRGPISQTKFSCTRLAPGVYRYVNPQLGAQPQIISANPNINVNSPTIGIGEGKSSLVLEGQFHPVLHDLRYKTLKRISEMDYSLAQAAEEYGFHKYLFDVLDFRSITERVVGMNTDQLSLLDGYIAPGSNLLLERAAFKLKGFIDFYSRVGDGNISLIDDGDVSSIFEGRRPSYVKAMGVEQTMDGQRFVILFRDGNIDKSRPGIDKLNFRKTWRIQQGQYSRSDLLNLLLHQLLLSFENTRQDDLSLDSIYIRGSHKKAREFERLGMGEEIDFNRTWFSFSRWYSHGFVNLKRTLSKQSKESIAAMETLGWVARGEDGRLAWKRPPTPEEQEDPILSPYIRIWRNDPEQTVLLRLQLNSETYYQLLELFTGQIDACQVEGIHKLRTPDRDPFIAKFEKKYPNFALQDAGLIKGSFQVHIE